MRYIGEMSSNSSILLEILTKDTENNPVEIDFPIEASINKDNAGSVTNIDNVILNTLENKRLHQLQYSLSGLDEGMYRIDYKISIDGQIFEKQECFYIREANEANEENEDEKDGYGDELSYMIPSDFQIESEIEVHENEIHITLRESLQDNTLYTVLLTEDVQSEYSVSLSYPVGVSFSSQYQPLYATPLEVKTLLKDTFHYFEIKDIYEEIRNAGQKIHQLLRLPPDSNNSSFEVIDEDESQYFPATQFAAYQASIQLLNKLIVKIIYKDNNDDSIFSKEGLEGGFTLGDLSVSKKEEVKENVKAEELPEIAVVKELIKNNELERKFWQDALMNRNARGYSSSISAISKGSVVRPESRDI